MNRLNKSALLSAVLIFAGCSQIQVPFMGNSSEDSKIEQQAPVSSEFVDQGRIIDAKILSQGKNIAIVPFSAGVRAEATYELDRTALMIVKGVSVAFAKDKTGKDAHFNLLMADDADNADLIVKGHITDMRRPSKLKRLDSP